MTFTKLVFTLFFMMAPLLCEASPPKKAQEAYKEACKESENARKSFDRLKTYTDQQIDEKIIAIDKAINFCKSAKIQCIRAMNECKTHPKDSVLLLQSCEKLSIDCSQNQFDLELVRLNLQLTKLITGVNAQLSQWRNTLKKNLTKYEGAAEHAKANTLREILNAAQAICTLEETFIADLSNCEQVLQKIKENAQITYDSGQKSKSKWAGTWSQGLKDVQNNLTRNHSIVTAELKKDRQKKCEYQDQLDLLIALPAHIASQKKMLKEQLAVLKQESAQLKADGQEHHYRRVQQQIAGILQELVSVGDADPKELSALQTEIKGFGAEETTKKLTSTTSSDAIKRQQIFFDLLSQNSSAEMPIHSSVTPLDGNPSRLYTEQFYRYLIHSDSPAT